MKRNKSLKKNSGSTTYNLERFLVILSIFIFWSFLLMPQFAKAAKNQVINFSMSENGNNVRLVFELDDFPKYRVFITTNPDKLVIDFQDHEISDNVKFSKTKLFKSIRVTKNSHSDLRIIILLSRKIQIKRTIILNPVDGKKYKLAIDLDLNQTSSKIPIPEKEIKYTLSTPLNNDIANKIADSRYEEFERKIVAKNSAIIGSKPIIVIDAGHGGKDPGTISGSRKSKEKDITLLYAKELKKYLDRSGKYNAFLTRNGDYFIPLNQRVEKSRKLKADLFISLHADSSGNDDVSGLSIYTLSERSSDKQAEILAQKENKSDIIGGINFSETSSEIMNTLINMSQRSSMNSSAKFAELAIKSMNRQNVRILQNTHRFAGFRVLTAPDVAAVLIELGYLSNKSEEKQLNSVGHRSNICQSILNAVDVYFKKSSEPQNPIIRKFIPKNPELYQNKNL